MNKMRLRHNMRERESERKTSDQRVLMLVLNFKSQEK